MPLLHRGSRSTDWIQRTWRTIGQSPTFPSCPRSWKESSCGSYRNTSLRMDYFLRCNLDSESIIPPSRVYFGCCPTFSPQWTRDISSFAGFARCECRFRHGRSLHPARPVVHLLWAYGISIRLDAVVHRRSHADSSLLWICFALCTSAFWCGSGFGARPSPLRPLYGRYSGDWSYRSGSACICMLTIHSFKARVSLQMPPIWLPEPWMSSTLWRPGCRRIGYDWTPTRPSSSGWAPATSLEDVTCRPSAPSCSRATSSTILESTWTRGSSWIVRWANYVKFATSTCDGCERCVDRSPRNRYSH